MCPILRSPEVIQVPAFHSNAHELQIKEQLVLVVDQVLQIAQQQGQERLAMLHKDGRDGPVEISVTKQRKSLVDVLAINRDPSGGLLRRATMVHRQRSKLAEVGEPIGLGSAQNGAE